MRNILHLQDLAVHSSNMSRPTTPHTLNDCACGHSTEDHDASRAAPEGGPACWRCHHIEDVQQRTEPDLAEYANTLADQSDRFVAQLDVDVSAAETFNDRPGAFRIAAEAYERIALAEKTADPVQWSQALNIETRSAKEIMDRLWDVRQELLRRNLAKPK